MGRWRSEISSTLSGGAVRAALALVGILVVHGACSSEDPAPEPEVGGPLVHPGQDCMSCHTVGSGSVASTYPLTVGGTVYVDAAGSQPIEGATVTITGADEAVLELTTNEAGNFYSTETVQWPAMTAVTFGADTSSMLLAADAGDCNACHIPGSTTGSIHVP